MLYRLDLVAREDERFVLSHHRHGLVVLLFHQAREAAAVLHINGRGAVIVRDDRVRVEDVLEDVIQVPAVRAGQVRTDLAAGVKQRVALLAGARKHRATAQRVAGLRTAGPVNLFGWQVRANTARPRNASPGCEPPAR